MEASVKVSQVNWWCVPERPGLGVYTRKEGSMFQAESKEQQVICL